MKILLLPLPALSVELTFAKIWVDFTLANYMVFLLIYQMPVYKEDTIMAKYKYLSLDERILIQQMLGQAASFKAIARTLGRNCSTISKEFRSHLVF